MHIAMVRREVSLRRSGAERMCVNLLRHLLAEGHRVTIVAERLDEEFHAQVEFLEVPKARWGGWSPTERFARRSAAVIGARRFDVIHSLARVPYADTFQSLDPVHAHWLEVGYRQPMMRWLQERNPRHRSILRLESAIGNGPQQILVQSAFDGALWQKHYGVSAERIRVVPNGVDTSAFTPAARKDRAATRAEFGVTEQAPLLLFAGNDFRRKGLDTLIRAMSRSSRSDLQLWVLGQEAPGPFAQLAQALGLGDRVQFLGKQSGMARFYGAADLFVLPTWYDPFACVVLEALACGTPVATTRCGGGADVVRDGRSGYLITSPADEQALTTIFDLHASLDLSRREAMIPACLEDAEQFTADRFARETEQALQEVCRVRRAA